jgi:Bifunctional DNA primase/polymerase, N-terminal
MSSNNREYTRKPNPPSTLPIALAYLAKHPTRYLFPLAAKGKPCIKNNLADASNDPAQITKWSKKFGSDCWWGLSLKKSGLVAPDIDVGLGKVGAETYKALKAQGLEFPNTETQASPSGGRHLIYSGEHHFNNTGKIGKDIDSPNYIVIAGCKGYTLYRDHPVVALPDWIAERLVTRASKPRIYNGDAVPLDWFKRALAMTDYVGRHSYGEWLNFMFAVHESAGGQEGDYLWAFIDWCRADPSQDWKHGVPSDKDIEDKWSGMAAEPDEKLAAITRASWLRILPAGMVAELADLNALRDDAFTDEDIAELDAYAARQRERDAAREPARLIAKAKAQAEWKRKAELDRCEIGFGLDDFLVYKPKMPTGFIHIPSGSDTFWGAQAVSLSCGGPAEIDPNPPVDELEQLLYPDGYKRDKAGAIVFESGYSAIVGNSKKRMTCMTWWPGMPTVIYDTMIRAEGGVFPKKNVHAFNRYLPPLPRYCPIKGLPIRASAAKDAKRWIDHVLLLYPEDGWRLIRALAYRAQHPEIKIHHAILLGGTTGIGKDTILEPVPYAVGHWNFAKTLAHTVMEEPKYNMWAEAVITLLDEAKDDLGDRTNVGFYNRLKPLLGGTAKNVIMVRNLYIAAHPIIDVAFIIITTNHKIRGMFIPEDDRRIDVMWSNRVRSDWECHKPTLAENGEVLVTADANLVREYFKPLYDWYENGGFEAVSYYLHTLDVTDYEPKAPPPKTAAWYEIVESSIDPATNELVTVLEKMGNPAGVTLTEVGIAAAAAGVALPWVGASARNTVQATMEEAGYVKQRNPSGGTGRWSVGPKDARKEVAIYVQAKLDPKARLAAANEAHKRAHIAATKGKK